MIDHLELEGYLASDIETQTVRLTPQAGQVLYHGAAVSMLVRKEPEEQAASAAVKLSGAESGLYEELRELRGELAKDAGVPAYVIFSNATLTDMARKKPKNMTQFRKVSGVGELKANWYGKAFLARIKKYLEEYEE